MSSAGIPPVPTLPDGFSIDNILGVILICLIIAAYLFGMSSSQAYIYYDRFPQDDVWTKALVGLVWALDSFHTALMSHTVYYYTVTNFGNLPSLETTPVFSFNLEIVVVPVLAFIVQMFFAWRAFSIERKTMPVSILIAIFSVVQLVFGIIACVIAFTKFDGFFNIKDHSWGLIAWLVAAAVADLFVVVSLFWTFYITQATFTEEDGWMTKILMYGVHTNVFTFITTIIDLIFIAVWPQSLAFAGLNYILGKMYTNTMFYALNRRRVTDPRYITSSKSQSTSQGGAGTGSRSNKQHNLSSLIPTFAANPNAEGGAGGPGAGGVALSPNGDRVYNPQYSFTSPRVQPKDPYAAGGDTDAYGHPDEYDVEGKRRSLTDVHEHGSETFVASEKP